MSRKPTLDQNTFTETMIPCMTRKPFRPFTVVTMSGNRYEVDHPTALAVREGLAIVAGPNLVPVFFDNEGVSEIVGDLAGHGTEAP